MPSKIPEGETRGWIVPIGGAENKENDRHILQRFIRVSGGATANIVVIPTASRMNETGPRYEKLFKDYGASSKRAAYSSRAAISCGLRLCSAARRWQNSFACAMHMVSRSAGPAPA